MAAVSKKPEPKQPAAKQEEGGAPKRPVVKQKFWEPSLDVA
ncbi:MAG: hypothetical protein WDO70_01490 [Alphaproteobacteria bacterium]